MRTKEQIVAELLKDGKITAEDATALLTKDTLYVPYQVTPYYPSWVPNQPYWTITANAASF